MAEILAWYKAIGCTIKTNALMINRGHQSYELAHGLPFKEFSCSLPCCGWKSGPKAQYLVRTSDV